MSKIECLRAIRGGKCSKKERTIYGWERGEGGSVHWSGSERKRGMCRRGDKYRDPTAFGEEGFEGSEHPVEDERATVVGTRMKTVAMEG